MLQSLEKVDDIHNNDVYSIYFIDNGIPSFTLSALKGIRKHFNDFSDLTLSEEVIDYVIQEYTKTKPFLYNFNISSVDEITPDFQF